MELDVSKKAMQYLEEEAEKLSQHIGEACRPQDVLDLFLTVDMEEKNLGRQTFVDALLKTVRAHTEGNCKA